MVNYKAIKSYKIQKANSISKGLVAVFYDKDGNQVYQMSQINQNGSMDQIRSDLNDNIELFINENNIKLNKSKGE